MRFLLCPNYVGSVVSAVCPVNRVLSQSQGYRMNSILWFALIFCL